MCMAGITGTNEYGVLPDVCPVLFCDVRQCGEYHDAAHTLGVVDSAMNKLEALENVNYIDKDGTDIKPAYL